MDRIRALWGATTPYKPLDEDAGQEGEALMRDGRDEEGHTPRSERPGEQVEAVFSWLYYGVFMLLGVAMLWAWNMFLAAGPYFQSRFRDSDWLLANFQSTELTISTVANLGSMLVLTNLQANASYPKRIIVALVMNIVVFSLMALSTRLFIGISPQGYFAFLMVQIFVSSVATGLMQNGIFAFMSGFGREEYAQGNMTGQAVAGVLPCVVQIVTVLSVPPVDASEQNPKEASKSALAYFATASGISLVTLAAFLFLLRHYRRSTAYTSIPSESTADLPGPKRRIPLSTIFRKTFFLSTSVFITFAIAMFFPVFTQQIQSVRPPSNLPRLFEPASFIPLAFLIWNVGDLIGRVSSALPKLRITHRPHLIMTLAVLRVLFIPLYYFCNVRGKGAKINSDVFYFLVQITYGITNGFIGTMCMMGAGEYVEVSEREATGAFMTLMLVGGLTAGSLLSFLVA